MDNQVPEKKPGPVIKFLNKITGRHVWFFFLIIVVGIYCAYTTNFLPPTSFIFRNLFFILAIMSPFVLIGFALTDAKQMGLSKGYALSVSFCTYLLFLSIAIAFLYHWFLQWLPYGGKEINFGIYFVLYFAYKKIDKKEVAKKLAQQLTVSQSNC